MSWLSQFDRGGPHPAKRTHSTSLRISFAICAVLAIWPAGPAVAADWPLRGSLVPTGYTRWDGWQAGLLAGYGNMNADFGNSTSSLVAFILRNTTAESEFAPLGGEMRRIELPAAESIDSGGNVVTFPLSPALSFSNRAGAPLRALLCIHLDTVYPPDHPFQKVSRLDGHTLRGPGVADAKGGLVVMLTALRALERSELSRNIGWEVVLNTDEEIG